jgi:hypothetical protein
VPSKKQRRRQAKERRHEYEYVYVDEKGREVEVEEPAPQARATRKEEPSRPARGGGRAGRKVEPPSWRKAVRRAALFGALFAVIFVLTKPKGTNSAAIVAQALAFAIFFIPLFYFTDSMVYRSYLKRTGQAPPARNPKEPKPKT